ncbi:hypothetical protein [Microcoleus sp. PH2017_18_LLB_O_A]|uniref:hypothetical protein n=1 Tax=Microcoleus sp. PH2017_18_LLB_O_A TaxID=2798829 RepID=UPI001D8ADC8E|nr:hypothetical protein [Microcoleus sp. PH2017_18_LLB_O_A]MCC3519038.1 hypothetical protein [Microcoleus sp. PH2017_18_LLB_O_A]
MLDKIWQFLKQLIQRIFRKNCAISEPPQPPTLTDAEYEAKLMELLEGVNQGWGRGDVAGFLIIIGGRAGEYRGRARGHRPYRCGGIASGIGPQVGVVG